MSNVCARVLHADVFRRIFLVLGPRVTFFLFWAAYRFDLSFSFWQFEIFIVQNFVLPLLCFFSTSVGCSIFLQFLCLLYRRGSEVITMSRFVTLLIPSSLSSECVSLVAIKTHKYTRI